MPINHARHQLFCCPLYFLSNSLFLNTCHGISQTKKSPSPKPTVSCPNVMGVRSCNHTCTSTVNAMGQSDDRFYRFPHRRQRECRIDTGLLQAAQKGDGVAGMIPTARVILTLPLTGTPRRTSAPTRASDFSCLSWREWPRLPFTARIERAHSYRARSESAAAEGSKRPSARPQRAKTGGVPSGVR